MDGNRGTDLSNKMECTFTKGERDPWWRVDLGSETRVDEVYIINRGDCCGDRLSDFEIRVGM